MAYSDDPHIRSAQELDDADERDRLRGDTDLWPLSEDMEQEALDEQDEKIKDEI